VKARLTQSVIRGSEVLNPGDIIEGDLALDFLSAGLAVPVKEDRKETATLTNEKRERATVSKAKKD